MEASTTAPSEGRAAPAPAAGFVKRSKDRGNVRKRGAEEPAEVEEPAAVERRAKVQKDAPLAFSTKANEQGRGRTFRYESSRTLQQVDDQGATAALETETAFDRDARALREQVLRQATTDGATPSDGAYHGMNNYVDYRQGFRREHTIGNEKSSGWHGPLRASAFVRTTARFDYQPDVCKDYKETGYCGYGDACKFVHDRSDYKSGWELEREWNEKEKQKAHESFAGDAADQEGADGEDDDLPFACFICRRPWEEVQEPVVTRCKHYFCEQCALQHNAKSKRCFVCEQPTLGIFNVAKDIAKRVAERKAAAAAKEKAE